jgi:hypothetical protein
MKTYTQPMLKRVQFPCDKLAREIDVKVIQHEGHYDNANLQQAFPICTPACPTWREITSRIVRSGNG